MKLFPINSPTYLRRFVKELNRSNGPYWHDPADATQVLRCRNIRLVDGCMIVAEVFNRPLGEPNLETTDTEHWYDGVGRQIVASREP